MPRMTPELIMLHPSYLSPLKDREIDLRGNQIPAIENLGVTKDSIDSLDLTDNAIRSLSNVPKMPRLKQILLANNPVSTISPSLLSACPNLTSLILTSSALEALSPTLPLLGRFPRLEFLSLASTPMAKRPHYRDFAVYCCRRLRVLDYRKVRLAERQTAADLFFDAAAAAPTALAVKLSSNDPSAIAAADDKTFTPGEVTAVQGGKAMTEEERARVRKAIEDAESVDEVRRLQRMLEQGFLPTSKPAPVVPTSGPAAAPAEVQVEEEEEADPEPAPKGRGKKGAAATKKAAPPATRAKAGGRTTRGSRKADAMDEE